MRSAIHRFLLLTTIHEYIRRSPQRMGRPALFALLKGIDQVLYPASGDIAYSLDTDVQTLHRTMEAQPLPILLRALLRNIAFLPGEKLPSVDTVLQFLCVPNIFPDPESVSKDAWKIWCTIKADLGQGKVNTKNAHLLGLIFKRDGTVHFSWNGELFFLNPEELIGLRLEIRDKRLYRVGEQDPEPAENLGNYGDVNDLE